MRMDNVIQYINDIVNNLDMDEETKGEEISKYYSELNKEDQEKYLVLAQEEFDKNGFSQIDMLDLLICSNIEVQKNNIVNLFNILMSPDLSGNLENKILDVCNLYVDYEYEDNNENYKMEYANWTFNELDDSVKEEKFEEICELVLSAFSNKNNENINEYKINTLCNMFSSMNPEIQEKKIDFFSNLLIDYDKLDVAKSKRFIGDFIKGLDFTLQSEGIEAILQKISKSKRFENSIHEIIENLWFNLDDSVKISCFGKVFEQIPEMNIHESNKKYLINDMFSKIDKNVLKQNMEEIIQQIHIKDIGPYKIDLYSKILDMLENEPDQYNKYTELIMKKLLEEKDESVDLSSKDNFEQSRTLKGVENNEIFNWEYFSQEKRQRILTCIENILKKNADILDNKALFNFYEAISNNFITLER